MNDARLNAHRRNTEIIQNDAAAAADVETLIAELTQVIIDGQAPVTKLAELKPILVGLHRLGMDPEAIVYTAIASARIRARHA